MPGIQKKDLIIELAVVTIVLLLITSALNILQTVPFIASYYSLIFALLFLYVPVLVIQKRGRKIDFIDRDVKGYLKSFLVFIITSLIVFPVFMVAAHFWVKIVYSAGNVRFPQVPDLVNIVAYQLLMVALPEEFYFRGYMQSVMNQFFVRRWKIFGVKLGWAWILTAFIFAIAHSVIVLRWWHFAIFFPALLFGYLRERTGSVTAPILFHALSNIVMTLISSMYY